MSHPLPKTELERLSKLCGMLGSAHYGEVLSAAKKANELVRQSGATWHDVIIPKNLPAIAGDTIEGKIAAILHNLAALNSWEKKFIADVSGRSTFSPKQRSKIDKVYRKVRSHYARGAR
jgi:hypothetical protein